MKCSIRLSQGKSLASICKSLGDLTIGATAGGEKGTASATKEKEAAVANESSEQRASAPPTSSENILTKGLLEPTRMARSRSYPRKLRDSWTKPTEPVIRPALPGSPFSLF